MMMVVLQRHHAEQIPSLPVALEKRLFVIPVFVLSGARIAALIHSIVMPRRYTTKAACAVSVRSIFQPNRLVKSSALK